MYHICGFADAEVTGGLGMAIVSRIIIEVVPSDVTKRPIRPRARWQTEFVCVKSKRSGFRETLYSMWHG